MDRHASEFTKPPPDSGQPLNLHPFFMAANTLHIITGYTSISPKPSRKAYLNQTEEQARARFCRDYPAARDTSMVLVCFEDELTIRANGEIAAY